LYNARIPMCIYTVDATSFAGVRQINIRLFYCTAALALTILIAFPERAGANQGADQADLIYIKTTDKDKSDKTEEWAETPVDLSDIKDAGNIPARAESVFGALFGGGYYAVPRGIRVIGATFDDGNLILNVSGDILRYGGTNYELRLRSLLTRNAFALSPEVTSFTLAVDGKIQCLPEGSLLYKITRDDGRFMDFKKS